METIKQEEKTIEVTNKNALQLAVKLLEVIVQQNRLMITRLSSIEGLLGKLPSKDIEASNDAK